MKKFGLYLITLIVGIIVGAVMFAPEEEVPLEVELVASEGEYIPNSEELAEDEIRITALGTGLAFPASWPGSV